MKLACVICTMVYGVCGIITPCLAQSPVILNKRSCVDVFSTATPPTIRCPAIQPLDEDTCPTGPCYSNDPTTEGGCKFLNQPLRTAYIVSMGDGEVTTPLDVGPGGMGRIPFADPNNRIICNETRYCRCDEVVPNYFECVTRAPKQFALENWTITKNICIVAP